MYLKIQANYPVFYDLLRQAGLANTYEITFLSDNEDYTVFIPSDSALIASQVDTLDQGVLQDLLKFHFIQGNLIFTDGIQPTGYYETARVDEKSTTYTTIFSKMYIDPGYDLITIGDAQGGIYTGVEESANSNIMTGRNIGEGDEVFLNSVFRESLESRYILILGLIIAAFSTTTSPVKRGSTLTSRNKLSAHNS